MGNMISAEYDAAQNQTMGAGKSGVPVTVRFVSNAAMTAVIAAGIPADKSIWYQATDTNTDTLYRYYGSNWQKVIMGGDALNGTLGATTPATAKVTQLQAGTYTDISGTPGNGTSSGLRGRAAIAIGASTVIITSTQVTAASSVHCQMISADATLTTILRCVPGAGSFVVTGNANATAATVFDFLVIN